MKISIIIPAYNCAAPLSSTLEAISRQTVPVHEVIIIDSSTTNEVHEEVSNWKEVLPIHYTGVDAAFPGRARNIGVQKATGEWIGFLDCKTVPTDTWLQDFLTTARETESEIILGSTRFETGKTLFQQLFWATTYGSRAHPSLPGSLVSKSAFDACGDFISSSRAGEDLEWISRARAKGITITSSPNSPTSYRDLPKSFSEAIGKHYSYAMANAKINVRVGQKRLYLLTILILMTLMVSEWNAVFAGWDVQGHLYISHITKIYLGLLIVAYAAYRLRIHSQKLNRELELFRRVYLLTLFLLITGLIYNWNDIFANWNESSVFYISHITKLYLLSLTVAGIAFRGIFKPLRNDVKRSFLFPWRWLGAGILGLTLDIAKAPGYIWGALLEITRLRLLKKD